MRGRPPRSSQGRSSAASDVYKSRIFKRLLNHRPAGVAITGGIDGNMGEGFDSKSVTDAKAAQALQSAPADIYETMFETLSKSETPIKSALVAQLAQQEANLRNHSDRTLDSKEDEGYKCQHSIVRFKCVTKVLKRGAGRRDQGRVPRRRWQRALHM